MKKRMLVAMLIVVAVAVPALVRAMPQGGKEGGGGMQMPRGAWWQRAEIAKKVGLTDEQKDKIQKLATARRKGMIKLRAELELLEVDLDPLLEAEKLDEGAINKLVNQMEAVRAKIGKNRIDMLIQIRKVLTRDQYLKLKQIRGPGGRDRGQRPGSERRQGRARPGERGQMQSFRRPGEQGRPAEMPGRGPEM